MTCVIKDGIKFYSQLFLEHVLYDEQTHRISCKKYINKELMSVAWHPT